MENMDMERFFVSEMDDGREVNIVDALLAIATSLNGVASALRKLGTADASTPKGAIEILSLEIKEGAGLVADAIGDGLTNLEGLIKIQKGEL